MKGKLWMLTLGCVFSIALGGSEMYKWVDENGVVHFTYNPPQNQQSTEIDLQDNYSKADTQSEENVYSGVIEQQRLRRELNAKEREQAAIERQARKKEESRDQSNCAQAIHYLNTLKKQCPVFYDGAGLLRAQCPGYVIFYEGDRTYVEDNEREQLIEHYGEVVTECRELDRY